jgi:hypothetical protein
MTTVRCALSAGALEDGMETKSETDGRIFLSYRREDSRPYSGRIYDELSHHYGRDIVFKDLDSLSLGRDFPQEIQKAIAAKSPQALYFSSSLALNGSICLMRAADGGWTTKTIWYARRSRLR